MANTVNYTSQQQVPAIHPEATSNTMDQYDAATNLDAAQDIQVGNENQITKVNKKADGMFNAHQVV